MNNFQGTMFPAEQIFVPVGGEVLYNGQAIGLVLADTRAQALYAAELVRVGGGVRCARCGRSGTHVPAGQGDLQQRGCAHRDA